ncbi:unnamed protein product, partial [Heterosigma akashiwo]
MVLRNCAGCGHARDGQFFSNNQWRKGPGVSRCTTCVENNTLAGDGPDASTTRRENLANRATFTAHDCKYPFAQGAHRYCAKGRYTSGTRKGQLCVTKWFKTGGVFEEHFFEHDIKASDKAVDLVREWNNRGFINKTIQVNVPEVWTWSPGSEWAGQKILTEPFIQNFEKFNSNSGWVSSNADSWSQVMQALSHFTYHVSSGQFVLCDLQGGVYRSTVVLTDPVILSRSHRYGITDLGPEGISNFFYHHECNRYCRSDWTRPKNTTSHFRPDQSTSMILRSRQSVSQRYSRPVAT